MKQVKLINTSRLGTLEREINSSIRYLIESKRTDSIDDIKITIDNNTLIGMIIYDDKGEYYHVD